MGNYYLVLFINNIDLNADIEVHPFFIITLDWHNDKEENQQPLILDLIVPVWQSFSVS